MDSGTFVDDGEMAPLESDAHHAANAAAAPAAVSQHMVEVPPNAEDHRCDALVVRPSAAPMAGPPPSLEAGSVFLSVVSDDGSSVSFCAYNEDENTLYVETAHANGFEIQELVEHVLATVRPTLVLLPNKIVCNHGFLTLLTTPPDALYFGDADDEEDDNDGGGESESQADIPASPLSQQRTTPRNVDRPRSIPYRITKTSSLDIRACRSAIMRLRVRTIERMHGGAGAVSQSHDGLHDHQHPRHFRLVPTVGATASEVSHYHSLASVVDFDSKTQVQAMGSLLAFLHDTVFQNVHGGLIRVNDVLQLQTSQFMKIHRDTLSSLNIFATEHHPLASAKGHGAGSKEGCSLFSLLDRTRTHAGRSRLREWMLKPLLSIPDIFVRQNGVELFLLPEFHSATHKLMELMRRVGGVSKILTRLHKAVARPADFVALPRAITYALSVCQVLEQEFRLPLRQNVHPDGLPLQHHQAYHQVTQDLSGHPDGLLVEHDPHDEGRHAEAYLDFLGYILDRCHVNVLEHLVGLMTTIVDEDATLQCDSVVFVRGFKPELDEWKDTYDNLGASWINSYGLPEDFEIVFSEKNVYYCKCLEVLALDSEFGDLSTKVRDLETVIRSDLEDDILESDADLRETFNALADLDCILSFADVAAELGYVRPTILPPQEKCIQILNGAHPLQELLIEDGKQFVRNDAHIDAENRINVVTGPNFSGKSCYARQVGILTYMAHLGSFLPCESAAISVVDRILSQFSIVETSAVPQSSFQLDLTRMGSILRSATSYSLVLIDEFGKGTSPASGIGLLAAALQKLSEVGSLVLCTTHFLEMFSMKLLHDNSSGVRALNMEVQFPDSDSEVAMPLFKIRPGVAQSSAGLACAKLSGVKESVLNRAREIMEAMKDGRRVEPLAEVLRNSIGDRERQALVALLTTDWKNCDDEALNNFRELIQSL